VRRVDREAFFKRARTDRTGPLDGVVVLEATTAWAGPLGGCVLADLGCDVIRVDLPGTPGGSAWPPLLPGTELPLAHETVNRNKRSITVDLRRPEGRDLFLDLVRRSDIVLENFKPGTFDGWGIGYEACRAVKEDIVFVSVSGYGQFGPWSDRPGYDPAALAAGGWMSLNGAVDGGPTKAPTFLADDLAGLHAALGAISALHHRNRTGEGQHVDVALLDSLLFQSNGQLTAGAVGLPQRRWGSEVAVSVPTNTFTCSDGVVYIAIILDAHWRALCAVMGREEFASAPGFATNVERIASRDAVNAMVGHYCAGHTAAEVVAALNAAGVVVAKVNSYADAAAEPHVQARGMLQPVTLTDGSVQPITAPAAKFSRTPTSIRRPAPRPGAQTDEVLDAFGLRVAERDALRADGII